MGSMRSEPRSQLTVWQRLACQATPPPGYAEHAQQRRALVGTYDTQNAAKSKPSREPAKARDPAVPFAPSHGFDLPDQVWEKVFAIDPRSGLAMNAASRDLRASTQIPATRIRAIAVPLRQREADREFCGESSPYQKAVNHVDFRERDLREAKEAVDQCQLNNFWRVLPIVRQIRCERLTPAQAVVLGAGHAVLSPIIVPVSLYRRLRRRENLDQNKIDWLRANAALRSAREDKHAQLFGEVSAIIRKHGWAPTAPTRLQG